MINFAIKNCPLCNKQLKVMYYSKYKMYACPLIDKGNFHYRVIFENLDMIQKTIVDDYLFVTVSGSGKTKIYNINENKFLMEISAISPKFPDKFIERLKKLIIFS